MSKINLAILASGRGTDMQKVIEEIELGKLDAEIKVVISNKEDSGALEKARKHKLEAVFLNAKGTLSSNPTNIDVDGALVKPSTQTGVVVVKGNTCT